MIPRPAQPPDAPPLRLAEDVPEAPPQCPIGHWLDALSARLTRDPAASEIREELAAHLRERVRELMLTGKPERAAEQIALEELGDVELLSRRYAHAATTPKRRMLMNMSILGAAVVAAAGLAVGLKEVAASARPQVPYSIFQVTQPAGAEKFLATRLTVGPNSTLESLINEISRQSKTNISVAWSAFEQVGIEPVTPIPHAYDAATVEYILRDLNHSLFRGPAQQVAWRDQDSIFVIAPQQYFDHLDQSVVAYNIADIVQARVDAGEPPQDVPEAVVKLLNEVVEPDLWRNNGGDTAGVSTFGTTLFITAPQRMHDKISWVLSQLPTAAFTPDKQADKQPDKNAAKHADAPPGVTYTSLAVQSARAGELAALLADLMAGPSGFNCTAEGAANSLLLKGPKVNVDVACALCELLDRSAPTQLPKAVSVSHTFRPVSLTPSKLRDLLGKAFNASPVLKQCAVERIMEVKDGDLILTATDDQIELVRRIVDLMNRAAAIR